jgi:hypothetical protein
MLALLLVSGNFAGAKADYYVSPSGSDEAAGSEMSPFATPEYARDAIRADRALSGTNAPAVVWLAGGDYLRTGTFWLTSLDSNTRYRARSGETPRFIGGRRLDNPAAFSQVTSNSPVWNRLDAAATGRVSQINLAAMGITNYGTLQPGGYLTDNAAPMELYLNGRPQTLARWPNSGSFTNTGTALDSTNFLYTGTRPERWSQASNIWVHGFFRHLWADFALPVESIDTVNSTILLSEEPAQFGITNDRPYFVFNLLEELDTAGEYYIDRSAGLLYYWPTEEFSTSNLTVSVLETPLLLLDDTTNVWVEGITFEAARGKLVRISDGSDNRIYDCRLLGAGNTAAEMSGFRNGIEQCDILDAGRMGVLMRGGIRSATQLVRGENFVRQCEISRFGRLTLTYTGGVSFDGGMGNSVEHCRIHDSAHLAIYFEGNDHLIEFNEIFNVLQHTGDAGVIYAGRDWSCQGNVIRFNFIHDCYSGLGDNVHAIYLDDCLSGTTIFGNVIYKIGDAALFNGGGRDNLWENNVVAFCGIFHRSDVRGFLNISFDAGDSWNLMEKLLAFNYQQPPWSVHYPKLAEIPSEEAALRSGDFLYPGGTVFSRNVSWFNTDEYIPDDSAFGYYAEMTNNLTGENPLFVDRAGCDLTLRTNSPAFNIPGFQRIPFYSIGITWPFEEWQLQYFGCTNCPEAAADYVQLGKDGMSNYRQFLAGLNPTNLLSLFRIVTARPAPGGGFRLIWSSIGGKRYRIQYSNGAAPGDFADLVRSSALETDPNPAGQAGIMEFIDDFSLTGPPPKGRRYYRVRVY